MALGYGQGGSGWLNLVWPRPNRLSFHKGIPYPIHKERTLSHGHGHEYGHVLAIKGNDNYGQRRNGVVY